MGLQARRRVQPADESFVTANFAGLLSEKCENLLRDIFRRVRIADATKRKMINKSDILPHQRAEGVLVVVLHKSKEQISVVGAHHTTIDVRPFKNRTKLF